MGGADAGTRGFPSSLSDRDPDLVGARGVTHASDTAARSDQRDRAGRQLVGPGDRRPARVRSVRRGRRRRPVGCHRPDRPPLPRLVARPRARVTRWSPSTTACGSAASRSGCWVASRSSTGACRSAGAEFRIAAAGPAVSYLLAGVFLGLWNVGHAFGAPSLVDQALAWLALVNVLLGTFNLIPAAPLDGGRILAERGLGRDRRPDARRGRGDARRSGVRRAARRRRRHRTVRGRALRLALDRDRRPLRVPDGDPRVGAHAHRGHARRPDGAATS